MPWTPPPVDDDPDAVTARILDGLARHLPGWAPVEGAPEVALAEEIGRETAITNALAATAAEHAVAGLGQTVFGLPAILGSQATISVRLTAPAGTVLPAGFTVVGVTAADVEVAFELPEQITTSGATSDVSFRARDVGAVANGVPTGPLTVVTATASVSAAEALSPSTGGVDPETRRAYLDRLVDYIATLRPGGVRAADLATLARNVPGVHRAVGVDLYDPITDTTGNERTATVFPISVTGEPVTPATAAELVDLLESVREVNFVVHVADPTYTPLAVEFAAVAQTGADPVAVTAAVHDALVDYLDPAHWGSTVEDPASWQPVDVVRYLDLARVAGSADGVAYLTSLTVNGATADVTLPGPAPLPAPTTADPPTTVTGTAT